jgi:hypothetical protein
LITACAFVFAGPVQAGVTRPEPSIITRDLPQAILRQAVSETKAPRG